MTISLDVPLFSLDVCFPFANNFNVALFGQLPVKYAKTSALLYTLPPPTAAASAASAASSPVKRWLLSLLLPFETITMMFLRADCWALMLLRAARSPACKFDSVKLPPTPVYCKASMVWRKALPLPEKSESSVASSANVIKDTCTLPSWPKLSSASTTLAANLFTLLSNVPTRPHSAGCSTELDVSRIKVKSTTGLHPVVVAGAVDEVVLLAAVGAAPAVATPSVGSGARVVPATAASEAVAVVPAAVAAGAAARVVPAVVVVVTTAPAVLAVVVDDTTHASQSSGHSFFSGGPAIKFAHSLGECSLHVSGSPFPLHVGAGVVVVVNVPVVRVVVVLVTVVAVAVVLEVCTQELHVTGQPARIKSDANGCVHAAWLPMQLA